MRVRRLGIFIVFVFIGVSFVLNSVFAWEHLKNPVAKWGMTDLTKTIMQFIDAIVTLLIPVLALSWTWVGYTYVTSKGNADKLKKSHRVFIWTAVGTLIILAYKGIITMTVDTAKKFDIFK